MPNFLCLCLKKGTDAGEALEELIGLSVSNVKKNVANFL